MSNLPQDYNEKVGSHGNNLSLVLEDRGGCEIFSLVCVGVFKFVLFFIRT